MILSSMTENNQEFINLGNSRREDQREVMETINDNKECPFCEDNLHKYHKVPILRQGEHWTFTDNQWPYEHTQYQFLAIARQHLQTLSELPPGSFDELLGHFQWAEQEFQVAYGGLAMRFGDIRQTGATVNHLHAHMIVPEPDLPSEEKVRFKIG
ncbi:MAG TPA: HIT domain-containing protein [Candidatus Microsaccharimonas sp.]